MKVEILRMEHVYVERAGKYILGDFKLNIYKGEMVVLFGLPGSGLEELGMILSGEGEIEKGRILLDEEPVSLKHRFSPEKYGIYSVFNESNLIPELSVAENLFLGWQKNIFSFVVSRAKCERLAKGILTKFNLNIEVSKKARQLSYFEQIMIKFIKAYVKGAKLLIVNEIIESVYGRERLQVISILKKLQQDGIAILWLNQRIGFVREIADRIIVLRGGKNVKTFYGDDYSLELLVKVAADTRIPESVVLKGRGAAETLLELSDVSGAGICNLSMAVKRGSIVGIWANDSLYLQALTYLVCGEWQQTSGEMKVTGQQIPAIGVS